MKGIPVIELTGFRRSRPSRAVPLLAPGPDQREAAMASTFGVLILVLILIFPS